MSVYLSVLDVDKIIQVIVDEGPGLRKNASPHRQRQLVESVRDKLRDLEQLRMTATPVGNTDDTDCCEFCGNILMRCNHG